MRSTGSAALVEALDELSAERLEGMFGPALLEREAQLIVAANRIAAELARTTRQCELADAADEVYDEFKNLCVWSKSNAGMGSLYRSAHEFIFVYKNGRAKHINNVELGRFGRRPVRQVARAVETTACTG